MSGQFRTLKKDEIEVRISTINDNGLSLLLYKTARTDANLLDEVYGVGNWQNDFILIDGVLFGAIGIKIDGEWVWKRDAGVESYTEKEKGRASDAFKRAGFKWGIGRELYSAPFIFISSSKCEIKEKNGKKVCYDDFEVMKIEYDANENICDIAIKNCKTGALVYSWKSGKPTENPLPPVKDKVDLNNPATFGNPMLICEKCKAVIMPSKKNGQPISADELAKQTKAAFGMSVCAKCAKELSNAGQ